MQRRSGRCSANKIAVRGDVRSVQCGLLSKRRQGTPQGFKGNPKFLTHITSQNSQSISHLVQPPAFQPIGLSGG